jgi:hypothetical protein
MFRGRRKIFRSFIRMIGSSRCFVSLQYLTSITCKAERKEALTFLCCTTVQAETPFHTTTTKEHRDPRQSSTLTSNSSLHHSWIRKAGRKVKTKPCKHSLGEKKEARSSP